MVGWRLAISTNQYNINIMSVLIFERSISDTINRRHLSFRRNLITSIIRIASIVDHRRPPDDDLRSRESGTKRRIDALSKVEQLCRFSVYSLVQPA